ncbi:unnamed protein product [Strongylus vulgaris]|uniref:Uncharacterized protein n=1 Tax=Strongylus vulgaris TaxID=40348 RepID=A0A3P7IQP9_STRVU|nr:unnamed protein product [Strongylus vulgaris]
MNFDEEVEGEEKQTIWNGHEGKIDSPGSSSDATRKKQSSRTSSASKALYAESPQSPQSSPLRHKPNSTMRGRRRLLATNGRSNRRSARLSSGGVVPGLSVVRAPHSPLHVKITRSDEVNSTPTDRKGARPGKVTSADKRSPSKLLKIPGMQNFRHGRQSTIIKQITNKYRIMAEKKRLTGDTADH